MGGLGSGNCSRYNTKCTEENFLRFSINALKQHGVLGAKKQSSGDWHWLRNNKKCSSINYQIDTISTPSWLRVYYTNKKSGTAYDYKIHLTTTQPFYGGIRWWFICPAKGCGKRVDVLYLAQIFACRHCYNLAYSSQNEVLRSRLLHKAQKIHQELGGSGVLDEPLFKPKGMHWKTYQRKVQEMEYYDQASEMEMIRRFRLTI